jgi:hypothetical protein
VSPDLGHILRETPPVFECFGEPPVAEWEDGKVQHLDHADSPILVLRVARLETFEFRWRVYGDNLVEPVSGSLTLICEADKADEAEIVPLEASLRPDEDA